jgi:hypothetical protein
MVALVSACESLRPNIPEVLYRIGLASAADTTCADLATSLLSQGNLVRDSSYEVPFGGSRCHEILYAADGNEIWVELRSNELTIAVRFFPRPGELDPPTVSTQTLADTAVGLVRERFPDAVVTRATEKAIP